MHRVHRLYITNALHISSLQTIQLVPFPGVLNYVDRARSQIVKVKGGAQFLKACLALLCLSLQNVERDRTIYSYNCYVMS